MNKLLRSLLKAGVYFLEQSDRNTAEMADRVKDRVQNLSRRARHAISGKEDHTIRNAISFAAGIGLGIGVGMLLAPSPGEETRSSIVGKVHDFGDKVKERFSPEAKKNGYRHGGNVSYQPIRGVRCWHKRPWQKQCSPRCRQRANVQRQPISRVLITEPDRTRRHSRIVYGYHPAQSQGHIKAVAVARAVQNATHHQRFCLGVIEVAFLTIRTAAWLAPRGLHSCASNWALTSRSASSTLKDLNCALQASQMPTMGTSWVTILRVRFGINQTFPESIVGIPIGIIAITNQGG